VALSVFAVVVVSLGVIERLPRDVVAVDWPVGAR